jgi:hypothetical protein
MGFKTATIGLFLSTLSTPALAVDELKLLDQYSLVGVIANDTEAKLHRGIAVIKDLSTKRSITLGVGESLPYSGIKVEAIRRDHVLLSDGSSRYELRYMGTSELSEPAPADAVTILRPEALPAGQIEEEPFEFSLRREASKGEFDEGVVRQPILPLPATTGEGLAIDSEDSEPIDEEVLYEHARTILEDMKRNTKVADDVDVDILP